MISDERLEQIAYGDEWYPPEVKEAVLELLAYRKAWREPVAYTDARNLRYLSRGRETALVWAKNNSEIDDIELFRKPSTD